MSRGTAILILLAAATLEAVGDAVVRVGLHTNSAWHRYAMFTAAAVILFAYGWTVNAPPWDFGKLLGLYVVFFFVIAQLISWLFFKQQPSTTVLLGGLLIIAGGTVISFAKA
jgi:small multidrug resistance family-3 protein